MTVSHKKEAIKLFLRKLANPHLIFDCFITALQSLLPKFIKKTL